MLLNALTGRAVWGLALVQAVNEGHIDATDLTFEHLRELARHKDLQLSQMLEKRWGKVHDETSQDKQNFMNELALLLDPHNKGKGDPVAGQKLFQATCAVCHTLFNQGNSIGPDLTGADRKNTAYMILGIVNPSAYIRPEYSNYEVEMNDDRVIGGLMLDSNAAAVIILDRSNQRNVLPLDQIKTPPRSAMSLIPEVLLERLHRTERLD